jgi:hypothetical protein
MDAFDFLARIRQAGFRVELLNGNLAISPASNLNDHQRQWIRLHKPELVSALRLPGMVLEASQAGNDIESANDNNRVAIHVTDSRLSRDQRVSCDMTVPRANLDSMRAVMRFQLKDGQGGGSLLGEPGLSGAELREMLLSKYGDRLATIDGATL